MNSQSFDIAQLNTELQYEGTLQCMSIKIKWNDGSRSRNRGEVSIETIHQALACTAQKTEPSNPQPCVMEEDAVNL